MTQGTTAGVRPASGNGGAEIRVGIDDGDVRGGDGRALQAAVEYVASLGGGTVHIGPGRYLLRNALTLRDNVRVVGAPGRTVLAVCDGARTLLACDGDCNERQITLAEPGGFRVGDGVAVGDRNHGGGFGVTTATLIGQVDPQTFRISAPLYFDYMVADRATAYLAFPAVGAWQAKNVVIEGLTIDGNRERAEPLNGCRGGGIYLFECEDVTIRNCVIRDYPGDGISFQVSQRVTVEGCRAERNAGLGLHPGSGSQHGTLRRNQSIGNGGDGLFVCWRVKHALFEDNEIRDNRGAGVSIGHKDTDNLFRRNTITGNGKAGVLFRHESEAMGAHRNRFESNVILDNAVSAADLTPAGVEIHGPHHDLVFHANTIGHSQPSPRPGAGIRVGPEARGLKSEENLFPHVRTPIER
jgi:parallel beta-helix repeat protein